MTESILIVDDNPQLTSLYRQILETKYSVTTVNSGQDALSAYTNSYDVVLLDRQMPTLDGEEVLETLRSRGATAQIAMVTAVEPDIDVIDMPFDAYIVKPFSGDELREKVESMIARSTYDEQLQDAFTVAHKVGLLETALPNEQLDNFPEYQKLQSELHKYHNELDSLTQAFDDESFRIAFQNIDSNSVC